MPRESKTRERILEIAHGLMRAYGYNGFSYKKIADHLDIQTASVHYHFPSKEDLGRAVLENYRIQFFKMLNDRVAGNARRHWFLHYVDFYKQAEDDFHKVCLCGVLAAEMKSLPSDVANATRLFHHAHVDWLSTKLEYDQDHGRLPPDFKECRDFAVHILSSLQGALIIGGALDQSDVVEVVVRPLKAAIGVR